MKNKLERELPTFPSPSNNYAWHFVGEKLRDGSPVPEDGEWLEHHGKIELCASGFHWSKDVFDALQYAPGATLCLVEYDGLTRVGEDKGVSSKRRIAARRDVESLLREFARWSALQVAELWDCPDVVRQYLLTGSESLRSAANSAARSAANSAANSAARSAANSAANSAAWNAANSAARSAANSAANSAAWNAANSAAWSAADSAASNAAWNAAWSAADSAANSLQRERLQKMVEATFS